MHDSKEKLPAEVLDKAVRSGLEYGWRKDDVISTVEAAMGVGLATIGGEVQFVFSDGTCELYWMSYDSTPRRQDEEWTDYSDRTGRECISNIERIIATGDLVNEGISNFEYLRRKASNGVDLADHLVFILYFEMNC